jgi:hypothetical protein
MNHVAGKEHDVALPPAACAATMTPTGQRSDGNVTWSSR